MPAAYANTANLVAHFAAHEPVTQERADRIHFSLMLRSLSTVERLKG